MRIDKIALNGFRNYDFETAQFSPGTNVIFGENAQGKTNLLEAVYMLAAGRSFRTRFDRELIGFGCDRAEILAYAPKIYENLYEEFPFLEMTDVPPKAMRFSRVMSAMGFTGFYFPFTGECNVNVDFPAATLPSTVAHELSHRRGIASEQECNFLAVLASLRCDDAAYRYAGALSGYIYLANALYSADAERWRAVRGTLDERVVADLRASGAYWAQFEGPVDTVSNAVYDGFLKSYGTIGVKSYGACVDLLVAYFK